MNCRWAISIEGVFPSLHRSIPVSSHASYRIFTSPSDTSFTSITLYLRYDRARSTLSTSGDTFSCISTTHSKCLNIGTCRTSRTCPTITCDSWVSRRNLTIDDREICPSIRTSSTLISTSSTHSYFTSITRNSSSFSTHSSTDSTGKRAWSRRYRSTCASHWI